MISQIIILALGIIGLVVHFFKHGEAKKVNIKYNWRMFLIAKSIFFTILYYGGFWDVLL